MGAGEFHVAGLLDNKVVIVAGLGGIGNGLARRFADEGALLVLGDLDADLVSRVVAGIDRSGQRVRGVPLDGADEDSAAAIVKLAVDTFGRLDGMHVNFANTADAYLPGGVAELPLEVFDDVMRVNARGFVICAKHAIPAMIDSGGGSIVFTASADAYNAASTRVSYQMSKAAELALMRHIARRYGPKGIRANAIAPGLIWHYKFDEQPMPDGVVDQARARQMIKSRFGAPDDIAALAALLLSDDGSFITAQTISVDGGVTFRP
ncbi:SDR family oxidoreductase [Mycolicibacterium elephantis]|uniref:Short-chain dehydrogenase n=1 Tax=Mycolicibacterium elephantis TaxID=81858 RepID=A0A0M2ZG49_9MYCO|nr:SDR family oxidoreductase [Mycolicibacterium elephantis]KKW62818.1 short-chain dehydrogenase [Mycolicibacterium elephantis]OBA68478.1 short-chain dehydrogenase [Mycolicibacterium elephantis]OBB24893.1 short-chain dehydrogenase [Mycolicibacterium elephantis]OBE98781.1 short-chain dehydrogenase [Mycolicibacterium elephantis]ORA58951.1 short-chain dehydrogenase [Mycolicibacterium elephantis]